MPAHNIGAPHRGVEWTCKVCKQPFRAKEKGQQCCSTPCQLKASKAADWPGKWSRRQGGAA